ncbi:MAG: 3'-5' exonuclease [Anaerolineales bacterium]|jgi:DNA polymerase III epsilon subunit-like protein
MRPTDEFYIVVDIEASGPTPGIHAMLSLGAATLSDPPETFYIEFQPDSEAFTEEAMGVHRLSMEKLKKNGTPPAAAMQTFADWVETVTPDGMHPIFVAFNAPFDWMYANVYFHRYLGYNPFGHKALDIKALFMGFKQVPFLHTSHVRVCEHYGLKSSLTHHALEDAVQEAQLLNHLLTEIFE